MKLRLYQFSLYSIIFLSGGLSAFIIFNVNPFESPFWMIILFYLGLFLFWASLFAIIGFYLKVWATNREVIFAHLIPTLRQSILISLIIVGLIFLQQMRVLNWWVALLLMLSVFMIELFFRAKKINIYKGKI